MSPEDNHILNIDTVMAEANRAMATHQVQSRVVDAAMAARAAYHAQVSENALTPVPPELAVGIAQMAFAAVWNSGLE